MSIYIVQFALPRTMLPQAAWCYAASEGEATYILSKRYPKAIIQRAKVKEAPPMRMQYVSMHKEQTTEDRRIAYYMLTK